MSSAVLSLFGLAILGIVGAKLYDRSSQSFASVSNRKVPLPVGVDEPGNNLFDPVNVRGVYADTNPVESQDVGPFGVPRTMRQHQAGYTFPTYGHVLDEF